MEIRKNVNEDTSVTTAFQAFRGLLRLFYDGGRDFPWNLSRLCGNGGQILRSMTSERDPAADTAPKGRDGTGTAQDSARKAGIELLGLGEEAYAALNAALLTFFYPGNPLLGELLFSGDTAAVFRRSDFEIPDVGFHGSVRDGAVFYKGELIGTIPIPFVFSWNGRYETVDHTETDARQRKLLEVINDIAGRVDGRTADGLLMALEDKWNASPETPGETGWHSVVASLVRRLARYDHLKMHFRMRRPYLLFAEEIDETSEDLANRRRIALEWLSENPEWRMVDSSFRCLGIPRLENVCSANDGYKGTEYEADDDWH